MKRFTSRYERIRHLRAQQEDSCRAAAIARNAERAVEEQRRTSAELKLESLQQEVAASMTSARTGAEMISMASLIEFGRHELNAAEQSLKAAEERLREALQNHTRARAELRIVEEMIQRERSEHRREQLRQEEHQLQEQAVQAFHRNQELSRSNEP